VRDRRSKACFRAFQTQKGSSIPKNKRQLLTCVPLESLNFPIQNSHIGTQPGFICLLSSGNDSNDLPFFGKSIKSMSLACAATAAISGVRSSKGDIFHGYPHAAELS
jgi:hypothetical protein